MIETQAPSRDMIGLLNCNSIVRDYCVNNIGNENNDNYIMNKVKNVARIKAIIGNIYIQILIKQIIGYGRPTRLKEIS